MCDAFLKVDWFDRKKQIDYATYDAMAESAQDKSKIEKKQLWVLIDLKDRLDFDISSYKHEGRLEEILKAVKNGKVEVEIPHMWVEFRGTSFSLDTADNTYGDNLQPVFTDHKKTVCIAHPDLRRAWIVETRIVRQAYSQSQKDSLFEQMRHVNSGLSRQRFESFRVLDLNFDGIDDYFYNRSLIYSHSGRLYEMKQTAGPPSHPYTVTFPPNNETCELERLVMDSLWTDGRDYYLGDGATKCNVTKMTAQAKE